MERWAKIPLLPLEDERMTTTARLVYIALCVHVDKNMRCFPSVARLQKYSGLARSSVQRGLSELEILGYVSREERIGTSNVYYVSPCPIDGQPDNSDTCPTVGQPDNSDTCPTGGQLVTSGQLLPHKRATPAPLAGNSCPTERHELINMTNHITDLFKMCEGHTLGSNRVVHMWITNNRHTDDWYIKLFSAVKNTPYLCGANDRDWHAPLSWILKNSVAILEGKYAPWQGTARATAEYLKGVI